MGYSKEISIKYCSWYKNIIKRDIRMTDERRIKNWHKIVAKVVHTIHMTRTMKVICAISTWMRMNICVCYRINIINVHIIGMEMSTS